MAKLTFSTEPFLRASLKMSLPSIREALKPNDLKPTRGKSLTGNVGHLFPFYSRTDGNLEKIFREAVFKALGKLYKLNAISCMNGVWL